MPLDNIVIPEYFKIETVPNLRIQVICLHSDQMFQYLHQHLPLHRYNRDYPITHPKLGTHSQIYLPTMTVTKIHSNQEINTPRLKEPASNLTMFGKRRISLFLLPQNSNEEIESLKTNKLEDQTTTN